MTLDKNLAIALVLGSVITAACFPFAYIMNLDFQISKLELAAVWTSYVCTILCVTQSRMNYIFGVVTTFLYSILFFQSGLNALAVFNGALVVSLIYGYWRWGPDGNPLPVTNVDSWVGYALFAVVVASFMTIIFKLMGADVLVVDVLVASLSAMAQLMLDNKKRQTWIVWAVVNVFSIFLFYQQELYMVMFQYVFFLANTMFGWAAWTKTMKEA